MFSMAPAMEDADVIKYRRRQLALERNGQCWADKPSTITPSKLVACSEPNETLCGLCEEHYEEIAGWPFSEGREPVPLPVYKEGYLVD